MRVNNLLTHQPSSNTAPATCSTEIQSRMMDVFFWFGLIYFASVSARERLYRRTVRDLIIQVIQVHTDERSQVHRARSSARWSPVQELTEVDVP